MKKTALIILVLISLTIHAFPPDPSNPVLSNSEHTISPLEKGFGVVLLSGPNLDDAKAQAKKFADMGMTVRVVKNEAAKKNRYRVVAGLFSKRTDAEFYKKELQAELKIKKLWVLEFTPENKVVLTLKGQNTPKNNDKKEPPKEKEKPVDKNPPPKKDGETTDKMTDKEKKNEQKVSEEISSLLNTYNTVLIIYNIGELKTLNDFTHPAVGFTVLQNSGAYIKLEWFNKIDSILDHPLMKVVPKSCQPKFEEIPQYRCELESWSKTGCFMGKIDPTAKEFLRFEKKSENQELPSATLEKIKNCEKYTLWTLIQTDNAPYYHKFRLYFGFIDGRWYITGIDLTIPCSL
ncbi:MAG: SPOR domain-containing protein [Ignavibacteria bacterium]|nr:SPOR domain-containing protein [Ignavibacteria bacterium]